MYLQHLELKQFRNYHHQEITFQAPKTILVGDNAQGKSNLLEAILLMATLRSHRVSRDRDLVQHEMPMAEIIAQVAKDHAPLELSLRLRQTSKRTLAINGVTQTKQTDFLGQINAVLFSCLDLDLVRGSPETRRNWLDLVLVQLEPVCLSLLQQYAKILKQRNALLKSIKANLAKPEPSSPADHLTPDLTQLALWDAQIVTVGTRIMRRRCRLLQRLTPLAQKWHNAISGGTETLTIQYQPKFPFTHDDPPELVQQRFLDTLHQKKHLEYYQGTSLVGPHRDEVILTINQTPAKEYGSQGQQRTLVLALKLAELELLELVLGQPPLLLLDDVLAELDLHRQDQLLGAIANRVQTVITTTHLGVFDAQWLDSANILRVENGRIIG
ncbi:MAG: DNA replication/repair protein RecF [Pseudanabaena sp. ELA607]